MCQLPVLRALCRPSLSIRRVQRPVRWGSERDSQRKQPQPQQPGSELHVPVRSLPRGSFPTSPRRCQSSCRCAGRGGRQRRRRGCSPSGRGICGRWRPSNGTRASPSSTGSSGICSTRSRGSFDAASLDDASVGFSDYFQQSALPPALVSLTQDKQARTAAIPWKGAAVEPVRLLLPVPLHPSLVSGWRSARPVLPQVHSKAEQMRNAASLAERWKGFRNAATPCVRVATPGGIGPTTAAELWSSIKLHRYKEIGYGDAQRDVAGRVRV